MHLNAFILIKLKNTRETISRDSNGESCPPCGGDSGMTMGDSFAVYSDDYCGSMCWPVDRPATHAAAGAAARGGFGFGGFFCGWTGSRCGSQHLTTGVVRHACRLRRDGTRRFLFGGILLRLDWEPLREHVLAGGPASHACRRGSGSTRGSGFWFCGGVVAVCFEGGCGGKRWPVDRQYEGFLIYAHPPPLQKKRAGRGINPKTDARSSLHNHPGPARLLL